MKKILITISASIALAMTLISCEKRNDSMDFYKNLIESELKKGDSSEQIEAFFNKKGLKYVILPDDDKNINRVIQSKISTSELNDSDKKFIDRFFTSRDEKLDHAKTQERMYFCKLYETPGKSLSRKTITLKILLDQDNNIKDFIFDQYFTGL